MLLFVCLIRKKDQVGKKRGTVCTHSYADDLLKNTSTKDNKYIVNQKLEHVDDINFRELFGRIRMFLNNIKKKLVERAKVGHGSLIGRMYRETDTVLKKLLILIKY